MALEYYSFRVLRLRFVIPSKVKCFLSFRSEWRNPFFLFVIPTEVEESLFAYLVAW